MLKKVNVWGLIPPDEYTAFKDVDEKINFLKASGFLPETKTALRPIFYNGLYSEDYCVCDVVGYHGSETVVISIDGHLHCINKECLLEMQPLVKNIESLENNIPEYSNK